MPTTSRSTPPARHQLTPAEREWIRRQGRAARSLEEQQRHLQPPPRRAAGRPRRSSTA
jgi:hypothetical protein